jgi:hypothetical protein
VPFTAAQTAANLNVVVVGWNDATRPCSRNRLKGNAYSGVVRPVDRSLTQSITRKHRPVAAGANTVTVTSAAPYPDVRVAEYEARSGESALLPGGNAERAPLRQRRTHDDDRERS